MSETPAELWCAHCSNVAIDPVQVSDDALCNPWGGREGLNCYALVENYDHQMPCPTCVDVRRLMDGQGITL